MLNTNCPGLCSTLMMVIPIQMLSGHSVCVKSIACRLDIAESAVSQHLRVLREAGLVTGDKRGYWVHYSLSYDELDNFKQQLY